MIIWLHRIAESRARRLIRYLPPSGSWLDIGSGTGHNAHALQQTTRYEITEADVVDMHVVGQGPTLFDGRNLPFGDGAFAASIMMFVLHYCDDPSALLREATRVTAGPILVIQSTYRGRLGLSFLRVRDFFLGRFAFVVARCLRFIGTTRCPLEPRRFYTRERLRDLIERCDLKVTYLQAEGRFGLPISRDLFVLERASEL